LLVHELEEFLNDPPPIKKPKKKKWEMIFDPESVLKGEKELILDNFKLSDLNLKKWAVSCSEIREAIR
jgi:hypothetical protein